MTLNNQGAVGQPVPEWTAPIAPPVEVLDGRYCRLEPLDPATHAEALWAAFCEDEHGRNWRYLPYGPFADLTELREWLDGAVAQPDMLFYVIADASSGEALGLAAYLRIVREHGCMEVGHLNFSPRLQRTRLATEAMYLMMRQAFALGYRRYEWKCDALNVASRAAAVRLGFRYEGLFRQAAVVKGRNRDTAWYSVIDSEWPALRHSFELWLAPANFDERGQQRRSLAALRGEGVS